MRTHFILTHQQYKILAAHECKTTLIKRAKKLEGRGLIEIIGREVLRRRGHRTPCYQYVVTDSGKQIAKETLELSERRIIQ